MDQTFIFLSPSRVDRRCSGGGTSDVLGGFNHPLWSRPVRCQRAMFPLRMLSIAPQVKLR